MITAPILEKSELRLSPVFLHKHHATCTDGLDSSSPSVKAEVSLPRARIVFATVTASDFEALAMVSRFGDVNWPPR